MDYIHLQNLNHLKLILKDIYREGRIKEEVLTEMEQTITECERIFKNRLDDGK